MSNPNVQPLAQDFVVAAQVPAADRYFFHDPGLTRLDDGTLLIAAPQWARRQSDVDRCLRILRSDDGGQTWKELPTLPFEEGTPFVLGGQLLMFVQQKTHRDFQIVSSDDAGHTWTQPETIIEGPVWNIATSQVARPDALYWAMDYDLPDERYNGKVMVRLDRSMSPLEPRAWSVSDVVPRPELPDALFRDLFPQRSEWWRRPLVWLEPNTVDVGGSIRVFTRCVISEQAVAHTAGVLDYDPQARRLRFTQFASWPGAQCKFFIIHDRPHGMYWMLSNLLTNSQDLLGRADPVVRRHTAGAPQTSVGGCFCTTASTASTGFLRAAWLAGRTTCTEVSCTRAPSSTGRTWSSSPAPAAIQATSTMPTCVRSIAFVVFATWPWICTRAAYTSGKVQRSFLRRSVGHSGEVVRPCRSSANFTQRDQGSLRR